MTGDIYGRPYRVRQVKQGTTHYPKHSPPCTKLRTLALLLFLAPSILALDLG